jgi:HNH endonuclease/AP2 domain
MAETNFTLTKEFLQNIFDYKDGDLYWKQHKLLKGKLAGSKRNDGYKMVQINMGKGLYQRALTHRIIFMMHHGYMPEVVDHIDRDRSNNRIENLRECTFQENLWNQSVRKNTKSGHKGVYWNEQSKNWAVYISVNKKLKYFGSSKDIEEAKKIADCARKQHRGDFS